MSRRMFAPILSSLFLLGCNSTGVGNPPGVASLSLEVTSDSEIEPETSTADTAEQLDPSALKHAIMIFGEMRYLACDPADGDVVVTERVMVDLAQNRIEPEPLAVTIPPSGFCGIDATLAPALEPPSVAGRSMFFSALRSDGVEFMLFVDMAGTLHMRPRNESVSWPKDGKHAWLWAFRPRRWLLPSELESADTSTPADVRAIVPIDVNRHAGLFTKIKERIGKCSTLHVDLNDDGQLDADERVTDAFIGRGLETLDPLE